jgi:hypothetical protein
MIEIPIRQSWLNTFMNCPEQARQDRLGLVTQRQSSDMMRGNLVHAAIEHCGNELIETGNRVSLDNAREYMDSVTPGLAEETKVWRHSYEKVVDVARNNLATWHEQLFPSLNPVGVEQQFRIPLDERDGVRIILEGTADWIESDVIYDWKNRSQFSEPWESKRWDLQSHVYCYAFGVEQFTLVVLVDGQMQLIPIERRLPHVEALKDLCWSAVEMIQADLKVWPKRWAWYGCSPIWCPVWQAGECRGKHLGDDPW